MTESSWRQLAAIPETLHKRAVLHALGIEPPVAGISNVCDLGDGLILHAGEAGMIVQDRTGTTYADAKPTLRRYYLSKGTPPGELARWWLTAKGYLD